jgi:hypothetical protein
VLQAMLRLWGSCCVSSSFPSLIHLTVTGFACPSIP